MIILGLNAYHGDVSAVVLRDGELVAAAEEERFRRVKHWAGFPRQSIRMCLEMAGISPQEVDHVAISRDPKANLLRKALFTLRKRPSPGLVWDRLRNSNRVRDVAGALSLELGVRREAIVPKLHWVEHHPAHLASAFSSRRLQKRPSAPSTASATSSAPPGGSGGVARWRSWSASTSRTPWGWCTRPSRSIWASPITAMSTR